MLTQEEERTLLQNRTDKKSFERLLKEFTPLILKHVRQYKPFPYYEDLVAEAKIGFWNAVQKFDLDRDLRLATYAIWWIRASVNDHLNKVIRIVQYPDKRLLMKFLKLCVRMDLTSHLDNVTGDEIQALATELNISIDEVFKLITRTRVDVPLDATANLNHGSEADGDDVIDHFRDNSPLVSETMELQSYKDRAESLLPYLTRQESQVFKLRFLQDVPVTRKRVANSMNITPARVLQIERSAVKRLSKVHEALDRGYNPIRKQAA